MPNQLRHKDFDSPLNQGSSPAQVGGYYLPEEAYRQLQTARDVAGFVQDLAAEVQRSHVPVSPSRLSSLLQRITEDLDQALGECQFEPRRRPASPPII